MKSPLYKSFATFSLIVSMAYCEAAADPAETVLFYGNSLVERLLEDGKLEAYLQLAKPETTVHVRSLAWTGDEVGYRLRPEGYVDHLKELLGRWPAQTIVIGFGNNESFGGIAGLAQFRKDWEVFLREMARQHPGAKLVLLSPIAVQNGGVTDVPTRNNEIHQYAVLVEEIAKAHGAQFIDLFTATSEAYLKQSAPLTTQGIHPNAEGLGLLAKVIASKLVGDAAVESQSSTRLAEIAQAAARKAAYNADLVRPKNGVVYYGVRKRPEEYAAEMPRYHQLLELADAALHDLVVHPERRYSEASRPELPPMPEGKSIPDRYSGGILKEPEEQLKDLSVADGFAVNLFASEVDFPDLKNPVQMSFDARGRLWVVTMPSFPHTVPGEKPNDKILILEDTKHVGKADKCTVFAEGFDALDGVAFHEKGVVVSAQPRLLLLKDTDGDGRADSQEEILRGVDVTDSHHGGMVATDALGHVIFSDGVFHRSQFETPFGVVRGIDSTTYRLDLNTGRVETEWQGLTPNPWKTTFDRYGSIFQRFGGGHVLDGLPLTWTPLGIYQPYGNGTVVNYGKGSAASVISSPNFPEKYQQGIASATLLGSYTVSISAPNVEKGPVEGTDRLDLLTSQNSAFRPVDVAFGFDGGLYVSDFASRIIGHAQHPMRDPQWNHTRGRIWRVVAKERPVVKEWPRIEGAPIAELLRLLEHPQDIVREHARIELRKSDAALVPTVDAWLSGLNSGDSVFEQAVLEGLWVLHSKGQARPKWLEQLLKSNDPRLRAAVVQLVRFQSTLLPDAEGILRIAAKDSHPRVRMAVVNVVSHLRALNAGRFGSDRVTNEAAEGHHAHLHAGTPVVWEKILEGMSAPEPAVKQMLEDMKAGTKPIKGRSVPVLELDPTTRVDQWLEAGEKGWVVVSAESSSEAGKAGKGTPKERTYRTYIESDRAQTVSLSVKHGYVDISANGVQLLSSDSPYSSQQQAQFDLQKGLNVVELVFRKLNPKLPKPAVYIYDMTGQKIDGARIAKTASELAGFAQSWDQAHADEANALKVQAVPNLMQFAPKELRVKAGEPVRIVFENPDLMQHNLVLVGVGAEEEVGMLADQMAAKPDGFAKNFIPATAKILAATPLVNPNGKSELKFKAPKEPGSYPYICTFPGHWRVMKGVLVVE